MRATGEVLAQAHNDQALALEGNWYLHPDAVGHLPLDVSDRLYSCPDKGVCNWVDLETPLGFMNNVAWVYRETFPAFRHIDGWFGFYGSEPRYYCEHSD